MTAPSIASLTEGVNQTARDSHSSIFGGFKYTPLDPSMDGIRLVLLCPSQAKSSVVECKVVHTAFGTKPSYEALSYTWGSDAVKKEILLDGKVFEIWENLWDALVNLRSSVEERSLWIDAICINQVNLVERNQQVQLMPYIYKRAQTVLIWLGLDIRGTDGSQKEDPVRSKDQVYLELCDRDYWKRVWIIQEIGKARRLKIHYGREIVEWNRFIEVVRSHQSNAYRDPDNIPMKLAEQLADRYGVGHQLRNLLITHQKALCKEPKDKIYGFIGLAIDCYGNFPMDYGKSLFEVYADVVLFQNKIPFDQRDILAFCRLAEYLLGGSNGLEAEELDKKIHDQKTNTLNLSDPTVLKVPAQLVGRIEHIGPSYRDMMAKVEKSDEWRVSIKRHLPEFQQKLAYEESDLFLEAVEGVDVLPQNKVFAFSRDTSWKFFKEPASITAFKNNYPRQFESTVVESPPQPAEPQDSYFSETRLFLLRTHTLDNNPCKMGLAPPSAQEGDFVCQIYEMERSVIVRQDSEKFTLVGCAGLAEDNITARRRKELGVSKPSIFSIPLFSSLGELEQMDLHMDIITAHEISRCDFSSGGSVDPGLSMDFETDTEIEGDIQVDSEVLGNTLRSIIQYYPTQDLTGKQITFHYPYRALMHYYGELQRLQANFGDDIRPDGPHPVNSTRLLGKQEHRELGILLNLIRKLYQNVVQDEISNYESSGTAAYEKLWLLFKPGIDVCARVHGKDAVFVVASTEHIVNQYSDSLDAWCIKVWNLGFDGRRLRRQGHTFYIKRYFGERSISLLNIFPITYSDNSNLEAQLISAGELFCHIINSIPAHMFYNGSTLGSNGEKYTGEIIIDPEAIHTYGTDIDSLLSKSQPMGNKTTNAGNFEEPSDFDGGPKWVNYNNIEWETQLNLTEHQLLLSPRHISGLALRVMSCVVFDVDLINTIPDNFSGDPFKRLNIPGRHKKLIASITSKRTNFKYSKDTNGPWKADFILWKGTSQVILLHGPPGTGKTYTVECVATSTRRPLLRLPAADIVIEQSQMEAKLTTWFRLADRWDAILLVEEADILMQAREISDFGRSSQVATFLRVMDNYSVTLFLITNRISIIDIAFLSRVNVALQYNDLDRNARRQIWQALLRGVVQDSSDITITKQAEDYVLDEMVDLTLNGREIHNILSTAIALAAEDSKPQDEEVKVTKSHFRTVEETRNQFFAFINSARAAARSGERDSF